jgi:GTPase
MFAVPLYATMIQQSSYLYILFQVTWYKGGSIPQLYGHLSGLKGGQIHALERIYRRRMHNEIVTLELAKYLAGTSAELKRQIGVLVTRKGAVSHVVIGDAKGIFLPNLDDFPLGRKHLRGLRLIHTHLNNEPLSRDDLTDLSLLRFDLIAAIGIKDGQPDKLYIAHLDPADGAKPCSVLLPEDIHSLSFDFDAFVSSFEEEAEKVRLLDLGSSSGSRDAGGQKERAILVSVSKMPKYEQEDSMDELRELAQSSDVIVLDTVIQRPKEISSRHLMGEGKIRELVINAMNRGATLLVFDQDLSPSQIKTIGAMTELKVIDRSQLILDIFARRAHSRDGKVQVELAQLKYRLPRLAGKGTAMSRLMGGVGGRGPGEMKLEIDRRRVRERINLLEKELKMLSEARRQRKARRLENRLPIVSIIGYTNAGKSTLLNSLTRSDTFVEDKLFATLDTASRRLKFPRDREVIITDTVGFIRDLPKDLMAAFKATLEELEDADLLLHVIDASNPRFEQQIASVEKILTDLNLLTKQRLYVFNKIDRISRDEEKNLLLRYDAVAISALDQKTFPRLLGVVAEHIFDEKLPQS